MALNLYPSGSMAQFGIMPDYPSHEIPLNAWGMCGNMHFTDSAVEKVAGYKSRWGVPSIAPYFVLPVQALSGNYFWLYAGLTAAHCFEVIGSSAGVHTDITRAASPYSASGVRNWQGGVLNGVPILNNGVDVPQMWLPVSAAQKLQDLSNWPVGVTTQIIRSYGNFLVALDVTKSGVRDRQLVKWSHPASAGAVPVSWDETDPTKDAGEYSLADTVGGLVDCVPLRDINVLYKEDSIWAMQLVGGVNMFRFSALFRNIGVRSKNCAVEYQTGKHFVLGADSLFVHDGQTITAVGKGKVQQWLFTQIDATNIARSFVTLDVANTEVWVCYPAVGQAYPNKALLWNWVTGAFGHRDLPVTPSIARGALNEVDTTDTWGANALPWGGSSDEWTVDADTWDAGAANIWDRAAPAVDGSVDTWTTQRANLIEGLVLANPVETKLRVVVAGAEDADGVPFEGSLLRTGIGIPFVTGSPPDISSTKFCSRVWLKLVGDAGVVVQARVGSQMQLGETPSWGGWIDCTLGVTQKLDVTLTGRTFALEFRSLTLGAWRLQGYDFECQMLGRF